MYARGIAFRFEQNYVGDSNDPALASVLDENALGPAIHLGAACLILGVRGNFVSTADDGFTVACRDILSMTASTHRSIPELPRGQT